jgi:hypothetical protein
MNNENKHTPAFPPQIAQDNFGRIVVAVPGMSKLEYFAIQLLPTYLNMTTKTKLVIDKKDITASEAAVFKAIELLEAIEKHNKPEEAKIIE